MIITFEHRFVIDFTMVVVFDRLRFNDRVGKREDYHQKRKGPPQNIKFEIYYADRSTTLPNPNTDDGYNNEVRIFFIATSKCGALQRG